jgi:lipoyl(octanoyl) transferase
VKIVLIGRRDYAATLREMQAFTGARDAATEDVLWLVEHPPVYTQGVAGRAAHLLDAGTIPVVQTDRGGQITYHGPGQVVAYPLVDLRPLRIYVKEYVYRLERSVIDVLAGYGVTGHRVSGAPGVYVRRHDPSAHARIPSPAGAACFDGLGKVAALGIKVSNHCCYHGVALNVAMDLEPFERIHPCGYAGLATIDLATLGVQAPWHDAAQRLGRRLCELLAR